MLSHLAFFNQRAFVISVVAFVIVLVVWNIPALGYSLYPFWLVVTIVHETGHGLAALITGGEFNRFIVGADGSGMALTSGGSRALILPAGYLGAALFGAALFYITNTLPFPRTISVVLAILLAAITLLFTPLASTAWLIGLGSALALLAIGRLGDRSVNMLALNILAILTGLNAVLDLVGLVSNSEAALTGIINDAAAFSREVMPIVPGVIWAIIWALIAAAMLGYSVYASYIKRRTIL